MIECKKIRDFLSQASGLEAAEMLGFVKSGRSGLGPWKQGRLTMIYLYALQGLGDIEAWLAGNASASRPQSWSGSVAQVLSLTGLDPVSSFREAC